MYCAKATVIWTIACDTKYGQTVESNSPMLGTAVERWIIHGLTSFGLVKPNGTLLHVGGKWCK